MASTIKLKNGSGAPLNTDLVTAEPALDLTNKRLYTEDSGGNVIEVGTNPSTITIPGGTIDNTVIGGTTTAAGSFTTLQADTSLNVDGTVTADENITIDTSSGGNGLTIQASGNTSNAITVDANRSGAGSAINQFVGKWNGTDVTDIRFLTGSDTTNKDDGEIAFYTSSAGSLTERMHIANNGDISFYDTAGSTAGFHWDAADERLGIGTTSPSENLSISTSGNTQDVSIQLLATNSVGNQSNGAKIKAIGSASNNGLGTLTFETRRSSLAYEEAMRIDSSGNVGIGTTSPESTLEIAKSDQTNGATLTITNAFDGGSWVADDIIGTIDFRTDDTSTSEPTRGRIQSVLDAGGNWPYGTALSFSTAFNNTLSEAMRIDSSGNLLIGMDNDTPGLGDTDVGASFRADGASFVSRTPPDTSGSTFYVNRNTYDGNLIQFQKDGSIVGSIGSYVNALTIGTDDTGLRYSAAGDIIEPWDMSTNTGRDNAIDLGYSSGRFDDIYATNGTIQTSDRNEKQDIEELSEAEQRVAVAAKGLLRKFRWKDSVEEKGDDARIHFGIIAQDLQAAFEAEGLDAGRYAMFIHSTWTDEETGEERSRMGVRYSELLAFIIAAI
jgi:hypothetical protein